MKNSAKISKLLLTIAIFSLLLISMFDIANIFTQKTPISENGSLKISGNELKERGFIALEGNFKVYDGLYTLDEIAASKLSPKLMTLNELRTYSYPKGTATATMKIDLDKAAVSGAIFEEIYTANEIYINNKLVNSLGKVGPSIDSTEREKNSALVPLGNIRDDFYILIRIANHEQISGQFKRNIFIGNFAALENFHANRLISKFVGITFYFTISLILIGLYMRNKSHSYFLTLGLAGLFNFYILLTHFEPVVLFNLTGILYEVNTYLNTFPSLFAQFFSALTLFIFYEDNPIFKHKRKFTIINIMVFLVVILILIIFDESVTWLYVSTLIYTILLLTYGLVLSAEDFIENNTFSIFIFTGLSLYIISYSSLLYLTLDENPYQLLNYYHIYLLLGQIFFYVITTYISTSIFSHKFSLSSIEEKKLANLVKAKTSELEASYQEILEKEKYEKQLIQDISHDLKSPITVAKGYLELIKAGKIKQTDLDSYLDIINSKVNFVTDLLNELFLLINIESNKSPTMDIDYLDNILNESIGGLDFRKRLIKTDIAENIPIYCNEKQIFRLFNNILENSIKHSGMDSKISISAYPKKDEAIVKISDNGVGIPSNQLTNIFNRFTRLDSSRNSNDEHFGLGLAISKTIVENHKGSIECISKEKKGTTFIVKLPIAKDDL